MIRKQASEQRCEHCGGRLGYQPKNRFPHFIYRRKALVVCYRCFQDGVRRKGY